MNERERILELVKKGVITSEEGLVLLENLAKKKEATADSQEHSTKQTTTDFSDDDEDDDEDQLLNEYEERLGELKADLAKNNDQLAETQTKIAAVQRQIDRDQEHITVIDAMEDLDSLTEEKVQERTEAKGRVVELQQTVENLALTQDELREKITELNKEIGKLTRDRIKESIHFDELRDNTASTFNDFGEKMSDFGSQLGGFVKNTVKNVVDNIDWNDVTIKVPGIVSSSFKHDFVFEDAEASILDIKNANGNVKLTPWDSDDIKVAANIKLFGRMDEDEPLDAFTRRSHIEVTDDRFIFQVPNKRVQADLEIFLPERTYDHVTLNLLNGNIDLVNFSGKDIYLKTTNGQTTLNGVTATMIEVEGVNGSIELLEGTLREALFSTVNGNIKVDSSVQASDLSTVNGNVRVTLHNDDLHRLDASSVHGDVKAAVENGLDFHGTAKTRLGAVNTRNHDLEIVDQKSTTGHRVDFKRGETEGASLHLSSTSGSIYLKDNN
ncbi:daptomycin-sensing surface protein LiaX [Lapidilactobacillus bayanensis]|uniref:daptomycin-sensing surface protein LiaX n=1 Tax=Lapidilactobacillus bayanensis TaxID=2485998 RepID=UPI0013DE7874|nr:daptomycin-sensing surface protein LiaX [Lapidilactobacillus bayanensis]